MQVSPSSFAEHFEANGADTASQSGFAIVLVMWVLALLSLSATLLASATNSYIEIKRNEAARIQATLIADAGIRLAMLDLMRAGPSTAVSPGSRHGLSRCRMPEGESVLIRVEDEAGKVDLNVASESLMRALFRGVGADEAEASRLIDTIADYRDGDDEKRVNGAEVAEYAAAGRPTGPKNAVFDATVELGSVLGMTSELFQRLRPYLTVHSGLAGIDPNVAAPALVELLARAVGEEHVDLPADSASLLPASVVAVSPERAFTIVVEVNLPSGFKLARQALVSRVDASTRAAPVQAGEVPLAENIGRRRPRDVASRSAPAWVLQVHEWGSADHADPAATGDAADLPQC